MINFINNSTCKDDFSYLCFTQHSQLNLIEEEIALADNESAREVLGDEILRTMAREIVETVRKNVTIDWMLRDIQAKLRVLVKRTLIKYGYPPDKQ